MSEVYLLLGGNLGDRLANMKKAIAELKDRVGAVKKVSSVYESKAWGKTAQPDFINVAVMVSTLLSPQEVLRQTQAIENDLGRVREEKWGARTMDIDLLFYDGEIIETKSLKIPHPLINMRRFVLLPMLEIAPDLKHPILKRTILSLYSACADDLEVKNIKIKL